MYESFLLVSEKNFMKSWWGKLEKKLILRVYYGDFGDKK